MDFLRFKGVRVGEIFSAESGENKGGRSCKDRAAISGEKSKIEVMKMFETQSSIFSFEMEEVPVDPVYF